jgi:hypothetical protein
MLHPHSGQSASTQSFSTAIIPLTAFGFGNAVLREQTGEQQETPEGTNDPFGAEPVWLLKEGTAPRRYNLDTLILWTLYLGLLSQEERCGPEGRSEIADLCRMLKDDLLTDDHWLLPLKGRLTGA